MVALDLVLFQFLIGNLVTHAGRSAPALHPQFQFLIGNLVTLVAQYQITKDIFVSIPYRKPSNWLCVRQNYRKR